MLKVEAVDSDKGINDPVTYSISSENWGCSQVEEGVGALLQPLEAVAPTASHQTPQDPAGLPSVQMG